MNGLMRKVWLELLDFLGKEKKKLRSNDLTLISGMRRIDIFWGKSCLSSSLVLNVNLNINQRWRDCSRAKRQLIESSANNLKIKYSFADIPLAQIWQLKLIDNSLYWEVRLDIEDFLPISELRFILMLRPLYKIWFSDFYQDFFTGFAQCWRDLWLQDVNHSAVGARFPLKSALPAIFFQNLTPASSLYPLVQVAPARLNFFTLGFRRPNTDNQRQQLSRLEPVFKGRLLFFSKTAALDAKIETMRQQNLDI